MVLFLRLRVRGKGRGLRVEGSGLSDGGEKKGD